MIDDKELSIFSDVNEIYEDAMFPKEEYGCHFEISKIKSGTDSEAISKIFEEKFKLKIDKIEWTNESTAIIKIMEFGKEEQLEAGDCAFKITRISRASEKSQLVAMKGVEADWTLEFATPRRKSPLDLSSVKRIIVNTLKSNESFNSK